jgi:hypothetical protein
MAVLYVFGAPLLRGGPLSSSQFPQSGGFLERNETAPSTQVHTLAKLAVKRSPPMGPSSGCVEACGQGPALTMSPVVCMFPHSSGHFLPLSSGLVVSTGMRGPPPPPHSCPACVVVFIWFTVPSLAHGPPSYGQTGADYAFQTGPQMATIRTMIRTLAGV